MKKLLRHSWKATTDRVYQNKLSHQTCTKCRCEKYFDLLLDQTVYLDRFGHMRYRAPDCVLPNTLL